MGQRKKRDERPAKHVPPSRVPKFAFGAALARRHKDGERWAGRVDAMYADYYAALDCFAVCMDWWETQEEPPSTKDQVFYSIIALDGDGAALVGENDAIQVD